MRGLAARRSAAGSRADATARDDPAACYAAAACFDDTAGYHSARDGRRARRWWRRRDGLAHAAVGPAGARTPQAHALLSTRRVALRSAACRGQDRLMSAAWLYAGRRRGNVMNRYSSPARSAAYTLITGTLAWVAWPSTDVLAQDAAAPAASATSAAPAEPAPSSRRDRRRAAQAE